VLKGYRFTTP